MRGTGRNFQVGGEWLYIYVAFFMVILHAYVAKFSFIYFLDSIIDMCHLQDI